MAKNYIKGHAYKLYLNTGSYGSPTWAEIKACGDIGFDPQPANVEVEERGIGTGHLHGEQDPLITFQLKEDTGDANVETLIAATFSGVMVELAVSRGPIATTGNKYFRLEAVLFAPGQAARGDASSYDVQAFRHANSDYGLSRNTAA
jgi:hypothetical protein